jgi:putative flippase GtrA
VGGLGAMVELLIFNILLLYSGVFSFAKGVALLCSWGLVFSINRNFTFLARMGKMKRQLFRYILVYVFALSFNYLVSIFLNFSLPEGVFFSNIAAAMGIIVAIPITFYGSLYWVFRRE